MESESYIFIFVIGLISAFFLIRGINGLIKGRLTVHNPFAKTAPLTPVDAFIHILQEDAIKKSNVPEAFYNREQNIEISGKGLYVRACLNIIFGLIALFIMLTLIKPELFDATMDHIFRIVDKF
jgi:hypothetical protein